MIVDHQHKLISGVFITFSGNCKKALTFYQTCFGGFLQFETFEQELEGYTEQPIVTGSLVSDKIIIHGSDLVHNEGRKLGNYLSIFLNCENITDRNLMINKLTGDKKNAWVNNPDQKLIEVTDAFEVRWVLGV
jgi:uncharacterized glyoxalase superfamily protein PhnB